MIQTPLISLLVAAAAAVPITIDPVSPAGQTAPAHMVFNTIVPTNSVYTEFKPINAADGSLWISKAANQYCPEGLNVTECTSSDFVPTTTFFWGVSETLYFSEWSSTPQQVYVRRDGQLAFTPPEGECKVPADAVQGPFTYIPPTDKAIAQLTGPAKFLGCPDAGADESSSIFRVYSQIPTAEIAADCFEINFSVFSKENPGAYAYE